VEKARAKQLQPHEYNSGVFMNCDCCLLLAKKNFVELGCFNFDPNLIVPATGTFTLSNLGMFGVDRFDAILPPGQVSDDFWDFEVLI